MILWATPKVFNFKVIHVPFILLSYRSSHPESSRSPTMQVLSAFCLEFQDSIPADNLHQDRLPSAILRGLNSFCHNFDVVFLCIGNDISNNHLTVGIQVDITNQLTVNLDIIRREAQKQLFIVIAAAKSIQSGLYMVSLQPAASFKLF